MIAHTHISSRDFSNALPQMEQFLREKYHDDPFCDQALAVMARLFQYDEISAVKGNERYPAAIKRIGYMMEFEEYQKQHQSGSWVDFLTHRESPSSKTSGQNMR